MEIDKDRITLKRATISDIELIIKYRMDFLKEVQGTTTKEKESCLKNSLRKYLKKSIKNDSFVSWIANYLGKSIGFSGMVIREQPGNFEIPNGKTGYILNMYTIKKFRNNGIGSLLFQQLIEEAKQMKLDKIELHATKDGEPLYRKLGFMEPHDRVLEYIIK